MLRACVTVGLCRSQRALQGGILAKYSLTNVALSEGSKHEPCLDSGLRQNDEMRRFTIKIMMERSFNIKLKSHVV